LDEGTVVVMPVVLDYLLIVSMGETKRMGYLRTEVSILQDLKQREKCLVVYYYIIYETQLRRMKKFFADQLRNIGLDKPPTDKENQKQESDQGDSQGGNDTEDTSDAATPPASS
jgi:hypothetical protein